MATTPPSDRLRTRSASSGPRAVSALASRLTRGARFRQGGGDGRATTRVGARRAAARSSAVLGAGVGGACSSEARPAGTRGGRRGRGPFQAWARGRSLRGRAEALAPSGAAPASPPAVGAVPMPVVVGFGPIGRDPGAGAAHAARRDEAAREDENQGAAAHASNSSWWANEVAPRRTCQGEPPSRNEIPRGE